MNRPAAVETFKHVSRDPTPPPKRTSRVAMNTIVGVFARIVGMVIGFAVTPVLLHSLGAAKFGVYAVIGSLISYFGVLDLGIGGGLVRYLTFHAERGEMSAVRQITTFGFIFYLILAIAVLPLVALVAVLAPGFLGLSGELAHTSSVLIYMVFGIFIGSSMSGVVCSRLIALHRLDVFILASLGSNIVYAGLVLAFSERFHSLYFVFACSVAQFMFSGTICFIVGERLAPGLLSNPFKIDRKLVRELFNFGAWTQVNSIASLVNVEADKLVISRFIGVTQVVPYQVGNRLALLNRALPLQLLTALLPDVTARISRGMSRKEVAVLYRDGSRTLMIATLVITGFIAATAPIFIDAWIGHPVPGADALAAALVISYAVSNLAGVGTTIGFAVGRPKWEAYYSLVSAGANVGLTILLVPKFGLYGVVAGTILGNLIGSVFFLGLFHRYSRFPFWATIGSWLAPLSVGIGAAGVATRYGVGVARAVGAHTRFADFMLLAWAGAFYFILAGLLLTILDFWRRSDFVILESLMTKLGVRGRLLP